jgi:hypothetical protein
MGLGGVVGGVDRPARCIFCGAIGTWWSCGCEWARRVAAGELARPRTVVRGGVAVIELCDELREAARAAGVITREYHRENAPNRGVEPGFAKQEVRETAEVSESGGVSESRCAMCGEIFERKRSTARYCSDVCRARAQRER